MRNSSRFGFTLIEALVVLTVFFLALSLVSNLFTSGANWHRHHSARNDSQRELILNSGPMERVLSRGSSSSLTLNYPSGNPSTGNLQFSIAVALDAQSQPLRALSGEPLFSNYFIYHLVPAANEIRLTILPMTTPNTAPPAPLNPAQIGIAITADPGRLVMGHCLNFQALDLETRTPMAIPSRAFLLRFAAKQNGAAVQQELSIPVRFHS